MGVFVAGVLVGEATHRLKVRAFFKPLASSCFFAILAATGVAEDTATYVLIAALVFSWLGDVILLGRDRAYFLGGLAAFLLGHVAYAFLFGMLSPAPLPSAIALLGALALGAAVFLKLRGLIPAPLRGPVVAYIVAISCMVGLATGVAVTSGAALVAVGAVAFLLSDVAVALERFVEPGFKHRAWGLPLYYGAQAMLIVSLAQVIAS